MSKMVMDGSAKLLIACVLVGLGVVHTRAQDKGVPSKKDPAQTNLKSRRTIPLVRVRPQSSIGDALRVGRSVRRAVSRPTVGPIALSTDARSSLLRESGIDVTPASAPREFRLSPRQPYISSSAYLFFRGDVEFNASGDSLLLNIAYAEASASPSRPSFDIDFSPWSSGTPQPDLPVFVGVLIRMDPRSRYLADFSVSAEGATTYRLTVTGAAGSGNFPKEAGGQHVLVGLESDEAGYAVINFSAGRSFTFHNVVVTKLN